MNQSKTHYVNWEITNDRVLADLWTAPSMWAVQAEKATETRSSLNYLLLGTRLNAKGRWEFGEWWKCSKILIWLWSYSSEATLESLNSMFWIMKYMSVNFLNKLFAFLKKHTFKSTEKIIPSYSASKHYILTWYSQLHNVINIGSYSIMCLVTLKLYYSIMYKLFCYSLLSRAKDICCGIENKRHIYSLIIAGENGWRK